MSYFGAILGSEVGKMVRLSELSFVCRVPKPTLRKGNTRTMSLRLLSLGVVTCNLSY
jgi:hypothetical protein